MAEIMKLFTAIIIVQLFYSFSITILAYSMPVDSLNYIDSFSDVADNINLDDTATQVQDSIESQTNIPVIELGALVFYSGNILIDLLLNFAFAIPEMIGLVINGIGMILNLDSFIFMTVEIFAGVVVTILYFLGLIQLLTGIRSGRLV